MFVEYWANRRALQVHFQVDTPRQLDPKSTGRACRLSRLRYPSRVSRIVILILLIVLLPLRGWSAERMAEHMAASAMPADCPMVMLTAGSAEAGASDDDGATLSTTDRSCQSCQLCMALIAPETVAVQTLSAAPHAVTVHSTDRFASVDPVRAAKPPIS